ncbi:TIGR02099 family protein [Vibrio sp. JC009]|uniref:YhdP family protein n=1 Tax=Vibrio sp. JC009 TaxID=2912314 RepID=UPI0023AED897|nr:YhdP family protein [Vibrio sp. JC009]WED23322.1 TIGR02099 family protein [Vibrio sp. JC009]
MFIARLGRFVLWLTVTAMVMLAIAVTALRVALPRLNTYQSEIEFWVKEQTGIPFKVSSVKGYWRNTHPSVSLENLEAQFEGSNSVSFSVEEVQLELDLFDTLFTLKPQVAILNGHGLKLDISGINLLNTGTGSQSGENKNSNNASKTLRQLDKLLLRQFQDFTLLDSSIKYQSFTGDIRQIDIESLKWRNREKRHQLDGVVSISDTHINSLAVIADFEDHGSFLDISGDFYIQSENLQVKPWLTRYLTRETGISSGQLSFNSWLSFERSKPVDAYLEFLPSELNWEKQEDQHSLFLETGVLKLSPTAENGLRVSGHSLLLRTDDEEWPELDLAMEWNNKQLQLNLSELDIEALLPLVHLMPESESVSEWINKLGPKGIVEDIRVGRNFDSGDIRYSASLTQGGLKQWYLLPEVHELQALVFGNQNEAKAKLTLIDDTLPYGDVFQAPLKIKKGEVDIVWESYENGWRLWSDKVFVASPDVQALGEFRLDFPKDQPAFLSIYAEADLDKAGETWRYLPTRALGQNLTNYLSTAIQGGRAETAQILWYGDLKTFPYRNNNGQFQAKVALQDAQFSFLTSWPVVEDLQLDLLFENESMYLKSNSAKTMDVLAKKITGKVKHLGPSGAIEIDVVADAKGNAVRDYMMSTPLVDSVGAALTAVQVQGDVHSEFKLNIPFSAKKEPRAWGFAELNKNTINVKTPAMTLKKARGKVLFDNDVVSTSGLSAILLDQPVSLDFKGENQNSGYGVNIDLVGDWEAAPLVPYIGGGWMERLQGHAPWAMDIDLQLSDIGFTYQIDTKANLEFVTSQYPAPLAKALGEKWTARMQASGNQESISARVQLPGAKYQTEIDITGDRPVLKATNILLGKGAYKISPIVGHHLTVRTDKIDMDRWLDIVFGSHGQKNTAQLSQMNTPEIPAPERINISVESMKLATIDWNDVSFTGKKKGNAWKLRAESSEVKGKATYLDSNDLSVDLERLHVYIPALNQSEDDRPIVESDEDEPLITEFDRTFHRTMPNLNLSIDDLWIQGYKVGTANVDLLRQRDRLVWNNAEFLSGSNQVRLNGWWELTENDSRSTFGMFLKGEDNTELMERFGISSGIQRAPFEISSKMSWQGSPWAAKVETLNGSMSTEFGKGVISDVSGAAKLLGLFSLDSIIRRMQLDFSDVFDEGLAFNSITGSGKITNGIFETSDIQMDAMAGDMSIKGNADLVRRLVDAEVEFVPDLTSGIPVITAFAVTPQTAVLVFAISKVISPVVSVFTKIRYEVKGPLDAPEVKEVLRNQGEYTVPEELKKRNK